MRSPRNRSILIVCEDFEDERNFAIKASVHASVIPSRSKVKPSPDGVTQKFAV